MTSNEGLAKVDFHLHSHASNVTTYYAANAFAIPESYSDPLKLYPLLKKRGMSLVTLTDHNSVDGVKEMLDAGFSDVFMSAEMTTTFPEDGCNIHVTAANITEAQFAELNRLRGNIYDMVAYLDEQIALESSTGKGNKIAYFMTHPLMSTQNRPYGREGSLTLQHLEKALLLCDTFEIQNGARTKALNDLTRNMLGALDAATIERLANKHDLPPKGATPWRKGIVGGSDDHAGINPGHTWTEFNFQGLRPTPNELIEAMRARRSRPNGVHGGPITLANSLLKLLYDGSNLKKKAPGANTQKVSVSGPIHMLLQMVFDAQSDGLRQKLAFKGKTLFHQHVGRKRRSLQGAGVPFERMLESEVYELLTGEAFRTELRSTQGTDARIFLVIGTLLNRMFARYMSNLRAAGSKNLVGTIKEVVALLTSNLFVSLPYLVSFLQQSSDCLIARDVRKAFRLTQKQKVVLLTDTFFEINGVSLSIKRMIREAMRRNIDFTVVTCVSAKDYARRTADPEIQRFIEAGRLKLFSSVVTLGFPEYDDLQINFPPLLDLLRYLQESGFTKMQISTPSVIGLTGLLCAKMLQMDTSATYHTSIPEYVENYTKDYALEALAWKYMIVFFHAVDEVVVPSKYIARLLHQRGLRNRNLLVLDRWVDVNRFHPEKRVAGYWKKHGIPNEDELVKFVYVGRLGVEKDLHLVAQAYRRLRETRKDAHLILVGNGPYRGELEKQLQGLPVTFTGFVEGDELPRAIASADVKLFPSTTDTWGNAALEAQACGLPVVVSDIGGPAEIMEADITGFQIKGRDVNGLYDAMLKLMDGTARQRMGQNARRFVDANQVPEPFSAILDAEGYRQRIRQAQAAPNGQALTLLDLTNAQLEAPRAEEGATA